MSTPDNLTSECLIVGGGIAGLTMAAALADSDISIILVDAADFTYLLDKQTDRRTTALSAATKNLFENLGIWDTNILHATPINDIHVARENSKSYIHYDHCEIGDTPFGYIVSNHLLKTALYKKICNAPNVTVIENAKICTLDEGSTDVTAYLSNGQNIKANLLIAADGRGSTCRELADIDHHQWHYAHKTITGVISHEHSHQNIALEFFSSLGPFALLPMSGKSMSFVYCDEGEKIDFYAKPDNQKYLLEKLQSRCQDFLGDIVFEVQPQAFSLSLLQAQDLYKKRVVLVGESAHVMHPIAGQGFNVSARDIAALTSVILAQKQLGLDVGSELVLSEYSAWRKFDITQLLAVTDSLTKLFSTDHLFLNVSQDLGFELVNKMTPIRQFFMKDAMGTTGDLPPLLEGRR